MFNVHPRTQVGHSICNASTSTTSGRASKVVALLWVGGDAAPIVRITILPYSSEKSLTSVESGLRSITAAPTSERNCAHINQGLAAAANAHSTVAVGRDYDRSLHAEHGAAASEIEQADTV